MGLAEVGNSKAFEDALGRAVAPTSVEALSKCDCKRSDAEN